MKIRLLTSMAGDDFAYQFGDIIDTNEIVDRHNESAIKIAAAAFVADGDEMDVAREKAVAQVRSGIPGRSADEIGRGWIEAGLAEAPKSEQVLKADIEYAERVATEAMAQAEDANKQRDEIAAERDTLAAQVEVLADAAGDGADVAKQLGAVTAERDTLKKQLAEREAQLGTVRAEIRAEFEAKAPAGDMIDSAALADQLAAPREALNSALAPPSN